MGATLRYGNGTYWRDDQGVWRYPWGDPVPGACDLTLADLLAIDHRADDATHGLRAMSQDELDWLTGGSADLSNVLLRRDGGRPPNAGDLVVGMSAPELHVLMMLTVNDIAELADVSKATIDSYRYRGYLPEPQAVRGRTPLWARPVVQRWLRTRPGSGWRSDIYGLAGAATGNGAAARSHGDVTHQG